MKWEQWLRLPALFLPETDEGTSVLIIYLHIERDSPELFIFNLGDRHWQG